MKSLTLVPIGGLANRFYAITSAIAFCRDHDITLRVIWFKDKGMGADFHSLFELSETVDKHKVEIVDAKWFHYLYDRPRKKNLWLPWIWQRILFKWRSYEKDITTTFNLSLLETALDQKNFYLVHCYEFYPISDFNILLLRKDIFYEVKRIRASFSGNNVVGIHIRRTDNINSVRKSPLELFIHSMDKEIELDPKVVFFVASDSLCEKQKLKNRYGEHILTYGEVVKRDNEKGIKEALIELYLLSKTDRIYGSASSSFSLLAAKLSGISVKILSTDNKYENDI